MRLSDLIVRSALILVLVTLFALQIYALVNRRVGLTKRDIARAMLKVLLDPGKYLRPERATGVRYFLLAFVTIMVLAWVGVGFV
jgi:hypothetical protein